MFTAHLCETEPDIGKWYIVVRDRQAMRRIGYCAVECAGHASREEALEHHLQFQLDRETQLWLDRRASPGDCEICGQHTTLRARLGRNSKLFTLCRLHQTSSSLKIAFRRRTAELPQPAAR